MSLFSIVCKSCAARLGVSKASAIGQILACPKCGTMIEIQPPEGWQPPADNVNLPVPGPGSPAKTETDFEDIENVLRSQEAQAEAIRKVRRQSPTTSTRKQQPSKSVPGRPASPPTQSQGKLSEQPILPTDQWTGSAVKKRRKAVAYIASIVGALLLLVAGTFAFLNSLNPDEEIAKQELPGNDSAVEQPALEIEESPSTENPSEDDQGETPQDIASKNVPPANVAVDETAKDNVDAADETEVSKGETAASNDETTNPNGTSAIVSDNTVEQSATAPLTNLPPVASPVENNPPVAKDSTNSNLTPISELESLGSEMGELSALLEQSNSSIMEFQDTAGLNRDDQRIGMAKYYVQKPEPRKLDLAKQLQLPCDGIRYTDTNLVSVLRDISEITGVPISLHVDSIISNDGELNPLISIDEKGCSFEELIEKIIEPLGWVQSFDDTRGLLLHSETFGVRIEERHPVPEFCSADPAAAQELLVGIQGLVFPQTWTSEQATATVQIVGDEIVINNTPMAQHRIKELTSKIASCSRLIQSSEDQAALLSLRPRWELVADALARPLQLTPAPNQKLGRLLEKIQMKSDITLLADWDSLIPEGWTPDTLVPGYFDEATLGESLEQLATSLNCALRAIDANTIELSSFNKSLWATDLEVYYFGKILKGPLNEQQALRLMRESVGTQLTGPQIREVYESKYKCFVVVAPQSIQKQVTAVVKRLENLGVDP